MTPAVHVLVANEGLGLAVGLGRCGRQHAGLRLIPIGHAAQVQSQVIVMTVFYRTLECSLKVNGICNEEAVQMGTAQPAIVVVDTRITIIRVHVVAVGTPRGVEEVFRARTIDGRLGLAVDENHVVALAIPHGRRGVDVVVDSDKVAVALDVGKHVVVGTVLIISRRTHQAPFGLAFG